MARKFLYGETVKWVASAAAGPKDGAPVLAGISIKDGKMAATDRHRLHIASHTAVHVPDGLYTADLTAPIEGNFPNIAQVIPDPTAEGRLDIAIEDVGKLAAVLEAAVAGSKAAGGVDEMFLVYLPASGGGLVAVKAEYLADALAGFVAKRGPGWPVRINTGDGLKPILVYGGEYAPRAPRAVIMPVRTTGTGPRPFTLHELGIGDVPATA